MGLDDLDIGQTRSLELRLEVEREPQLEAVCDDVSRIGRLPGEAVIAALDLESAGVVVLGRRTPPVGC
jgi:hypothetical protein